MHALSKLNAVVALFTEIKSFLTKRSLVQTVTVLVTVLCFHQALAVRGIDEITQVEGITEYRLKNGLQVLLYPDQTKDSITVNVTYYVGSKHENYGETGMAHLLEHLLFKGTPKHPNIPDELSARGAKPNGTTSADRTNYFETFAATDDNLEWALGLEADRMVNSFVRKEDLDSEMTVVRNELERGENNPFRVTLQKMRAAAYMWHNYGKSTIGAVSDLENVSIDNLKAFYKKYYQPDNATLIVAGKFDQEKTLKLIKKTFGKIKKPKRVLPPQYTREPAGDGEREITVRRVGDIKLSLFGYHTPAAAHEDNAALEMLAFILGDTPTGRLHKALVEKKIATQVFSWSDTNADSSMFMLGAVLGKEDTISTAEAEINRVVKNLAGNPITDKEFERAKRSYLNGFDKSSSNTERVAIGLSDWVTSGDWRLRFLRRDQIRELKQSQIQAVAEKYLLKSNLIVGRFIPTSSPQRVELPSAPNLAKLLDGYQGDEDIALGETFDPSYENIHSKTKNKVIGETIKVRYIPKKTRGEKVNIAFSLRFGNETTLANTHRYTDVFASMLTKGTKTKNREQITDAFDEINTQASFQSSAGKLTIYLDTKSEYVAQAISLVSEMLKESTFPEKELALLKASRKTGLEFALQDPKQIAQSAASKRLITVDPSHPSYSASVQEEIDYLETYDTGDLKAFQEKFLSADNMLVSAVGDFDEKTLFSALEENFASWKKSLSYERITLPFIAIDNSRLTFDTPDKENGIFLAIDLFNLNRDHPDYPALYLGNTVFGGGFINSRLATRMRQKEGWSYGAGASISASKISPRTRSHAYAIGAPQNLKKIEAAYKEELNKLLEEGFTKDEIQNAKNGIKQRRKLGRSSDAGLTGKLLNDLRFDETILDEQAFEQALLNLSDDQVLKTMKKYYSPEKMLYIQAGDMKKASQGE